MEFTMKQKLGAGLVSVLSSIALAAHFVGGVDKRALHILVLGILLVVSAAYYGAANKYGTSRWVFILLVVAANHFLPPLGGRRLPLTDKTYGRIDSSDG